MPEPIRDQVDGVLDRWKHERPDLDFAPAEITQEYGRALRLGGGIDIRV